MWRKTEQGMEILECWGESELCYWIGKSWSHWEGNIGVHL